MGTPSPSVTVSTRPARAPYSRRAAAWTTAQETALEASGVGRSTRQALRRFAAQETAAGRRLDFTPHQLATLGGCHVRTIYRELQALRSASLVKILEPGNRGRRTAVLLELGEAWPTWSTESRVTKSPSPRDLRSQKNEHPPCPRPPASGKGRQGGARPGENEGATGARGRGQEPRKTPWKGLAKVLADLLHQAGADFPGIRKAVQKAEEEGRTKEALRNARTALEYLATRPDWVTPGREPGVVLAAVLDPVRGRRIRHQLVHHRRTRRRGRAGEAPPAAGKPWEPIGAPLAPSDRPMLTAIHTSWAEDQIQAAQGRLRELPKESQARIRAEVEAEPCPWFAERVLVRAVARETYATKS